MGKAVQWAGMLSENSTTFSALGRCSKDGVGIQAALAGEGQDG